MSCKLYKTEIFLYTILFLFLKLTTGKVEATVVTAVMAAMAAVTPTCVEVFCEGAVVASHSHLLTVSDSSAVCAFVLTASSIPFTMFESSVFIDLQKTQLQLPKHSLTIFSFITFNIFLYNFSTFKSYIVIQAFIYNNSNVQSNFSFSTT